MPIFSTLFAIRADMRHRCCVMEWACGRWCRIHKGYASLHETLIAINTTSWVETQTEQTNWPYDQDGMAGHEWAIRWSDSISTKDCQENKHLVKQWTWKSGEDIEQAFLFRVDLK